MRLLLKNQISLLFWKFIVISSSEVFYPTHPYILALGFCIQPMGVF